MQQISSFFGGGGGVHLYFINIGLKLHWLCLPSAFILCKHFTLSDDLELHHLIFSSISWLWAPSADIGFHQLPLSSTSIWMLLAICKYGLSIDFTIKTHSSKSWSWVKDGKILGDPSRWQYLESLAITCNTRYSCENDGIYAAKQ